MSFDSSPSSVPTDYGDGNSGVNKRLGDTIEVNSDLRKIQEEWEHLLSREDMELKSMPASLIYNQECREKYSVCALWMDDAAMGFSVDYPYDSFELKCYWLRQSKAFTEFFFLCCFIHIISPFFEEPDCPWMQRGESSAVTAENGFFSPMLINVVTMLCILVYILDLFLWLRVNNRDRSPMTVIYYKNGWVLIRCILTALLLIDSLVFFGTSRPIRFARGLAPFVYISRRVSMRQLLQGLSLVMTKTVNVLMLFTAMVFIYGYTGFLIFHNVETEAENRFGTLPSAVLTVLHVLAGRSYNAFVGNQYFEVNFVAGFFFVSLMIAGDFLCTNLIIAVGNRQFKIFSSHIYKRQLCNRRQALITIHEVLSDENGRITLSTWLQFCAQIRGVIRVSPHVANVLFSLEAESDTELSTYHTIDCIGLFRLAALIAARVDMMSQQGVTQPSKTAMEREKREEDEQDEWTRGRESSIIRQKEDNFMTLDVFGVDDIMSSNLFGFANASGTEDGGDGAPVQNQSIELSPRPSLPVIPKEGLRGSSCGPSQSQSHSAVCRAWQSLRRTCNTAIEYNISVKEYLPFLMKKDADLLISPFALLFSVVRIVLAVQMVKVSGYDGNKPWLRAGWVIQAFLMLESVILISGLGFNQYFRRSGSSYSFVLNLLSLCLMIVVGTNGGKQGRPAFILLLIVQVFRFFRSFRFLRDYDFMMSLVPLIVRMLILYSCIIYFFAVIGYTRLCNSFPSDISTSDVDDDGAAWEEFSSLLNFSSLLKTIFTLYEVSVLGNWSIIMGAASREEPVLAFLFFLPYRLLMAMLVIPLLFSFIMQAFISHRDKLARKEVEPEKVAKYSQGDRYFFSETNSEEAPVDDPEQIKRSVDDAVEQIMRRNAKEDSQRAAGANSMRKVQRRASMRSINLSQSFMDIAEGNFFGPDISIPTLKSGPDNSDPSNNAKAIRSGEKGQSMMSFWSGGVQGPSTLQRDQRNVEVLANMLEEALFQLGRTLDDKADTLITLEALKERSEKMNQQQFQESEEGEEEQD